MGINCASVIGDLFLFSYERNLMAPLSGYKQAEMCIYNIYNPDFEGIVNRIYSPEL